MLRSIYDKRSKVCDCSKTWWDEELLYQVRKTSQMRKENEEEGMNQEDRMRSWKAEKERKRIMVRGKKKEY